MKIIRKIVITLKYISVYFENTRKYLKSTYLGKYKGELNNAKPLRQSLNRHYKSKLC